MPRAGKDADLIDYAAAYAYLDRDRDQHLMHLGALAYEAVRSVYTVERDGALDALAIVVAQHVPEIDDRPTIMLAASGAEAFARLLARHDWPAPAIWTAHRRDLLAALEQHLGSRHDPQRGMLYAIATTPPHRPHPSVRRLTPEDAGVLDLAPCSLSPTALCNWLKRGWRAFGCVERGALLSHALAAYPIGDTEEVSAVYTAPAARGQGLASAVAAATIADIAAHQRRAIYVTSKTNIASQRVAAGLGLTPLFETWEIATP